MIKITELGDVTSYKKLYMQFEDGEGNKCNIILNNPKNLDDGDYADLAAQDAAIRSAGSGREEAVRIPLTSWPDR